MFDIDKMFISMLLYHFVDGKITDEFEENTKGYYQNRLIKDYLTLLLDPDSMNLTHRSIDNDTKLLKDVLKDIEGSSDQLVEKPYGFYTLATQTERKNDYITGKIGIGPFALNNNNHILTMMYNVHFKDIDGSIMSTLNLTSLARRKDVDNKSIMSWISALINAHVDIAKDPYISRLNVNKFTYNLVNTLIRTGFGKNTFYFTTQPIMKALANTYNAASSSYMSDSNKSIYTIQREAINKLVEDLFNGLEIPGIGKFEDVIESLGHPTEFKKSSEKISKAFRDVVNSGVLRQSAKDNNDITNESKKYSVGAVTYNNK